jgi:biotin carboxylase
MQNGPYIAERLLPKVVREYCERAAITFHAYSDEWVLQLTKDDTKKWIVGYKFDLNNSAAGELAQDKVATYAALKANSIQAIPHYLVRSLPNELIHVQELHQLLNAMPVVAKPLEGTGGRFVTRFESTDDALAMIRVSGEPAWALSPHYELETEYRLIMLDENILLSFEKTQPTFRGQLKLFNLGYGAVAKDIDSEMLPKLASLAQRVMDATALHLAAVDIVRTADGSLYVLEVNDGISVEHYSRQSDDFKQRAESVYANIVEVMFR